MVTQWSVLLDYILMFLRHPCGESEEPVLIPLPPWSPARTSQLWRSVTAWLRPHLREKCLQHRLFLIRRPATFSNLLSSYHMGTSQNLQELLLLLNRGGAPQETAASLWICGPWETFAVLRRRSRGSLPSSFIFTLPLPNRHCTAGYAELTCELQRPSSSSWTNLNQQESELHQASCCCQSICEEHEESHGLPSAWQRGASQDRFFFRSKHTSHKAHKLQLTVITCWEQKMMHQNDPETKQIFPENRKQRPV